MKRVVLTLGVLALTSGMAFAQDVNDPEPSAVAGQPARATAPHSALEKALIANENKLMDALAKKDKAAFAALVTPDAIALDPMMGVMKTAEFIAMIDQMSMTSSKISDEKIHWIDPNNAVLSYKWTGAATFQGQKFPSPVWATTVWTKKGDKWLAVFHQETEVAQAK